jgi:hypothetical protein
MDYSQLSRETIEGLTTHCRATPHVAILDRIL